jgi:ATP-dependent DNA ligase
VLEKMKSTSSGPTAFAYACKIGLEGIVSKRKDSAYRSGRSSDWLKMKNVDAPAVTREEEGGMKEKAMSGKNRTMIYRATCSKFNRNWTST